MTLANRMNDIGFLRVKKAAKDKRFEEFCQKQEEDEKVTVDTLRNQLGND